MTTIPSKTFFYSEVEGGVKTRSIEIPRVGYLEAIYQHFAELTASKVLFNKARAIIGEPIVYCIECIEEAHATKNSKKPHKLLELFSKIKDADSRFRSENLKTAIDFLLENVQPIGEGILNEISTPDSSSKGVGEKFLDILVDLTCIHSQNRESASALLHAYNRYLEEFFQFGQPDKNLSDKQKYVGKGMMKVYSILEIEPPSYFKDVRLNILNGVAKKVFDIVSTPNSGSGSKIDDLIVDIVNSTFYKLVLQPNDPIAFVQNCEKTLLKAKGDNGQLAYLFNSKSFSTTAQTVEELRFRMLGVHSKGFRSPAEDVETLLQMMPN